MPYDKYFPNWEDTEVYGGWDLEKIYPAQVPAPPHGWNGWACPRFDRETAVQVAKDTNKLHRSIGEDCIYESGIFLWDGDDLILYTPMWQDEDEGDLSGLMIHEPDGDGYYHIGSHGWCWEDVKVHGDPREVAACG